MRAGLLCLLLAGAAANPDCDTPLPFVNSFHPWPAGNEAHCLVDLRGGWRPPGEDSSRAWYIYQDRSDSSRGSSCEYFIFLGDTSLVRSLTLQPTADALLREDVRARDEVAMDSTAMVTWEEDSTRLAAITHDQSRRNCLAAIVDSIGGQLFLDLAPCSRDFDSTPLGLSLMMPAHWVWRAEVSLDTLRLFSLSSLWLVERLDSLAPTLAHESQPHLVLITAPTESLSRFLLHHARDTLAFPPGFAATLVRIRP